jgi:L-lysine exporter family protein LysE/ArgO
MSIAAAAASGFFLGAGLIIAIGPQNAFVLSQGLRRHRAALVALVCALCDAALIAVGAGGVGAALAESETLTKWCGLAAAVFLCGYGAIVLRRALAGGAFFSSADDASPQTTGGAMRLAAVALGFSLLNPHVYLDTVLVLGSIAAQHPPPQRIAFGAGAIAASFAWFFALALGAVKLAPLFARPAARRILDIVIAAIMWSVAAGVFAATLG